MASANSANTNNEHLYGSTHGGSGNMPFLPEGELCCQYHTFIFKSKNPEEVIFGHTPDCNISQSLLDYRHAQFFAVYPKGPFGDLHPIMETTSNPPILRRMPKWADEGKPVYWYVDSKEKNIKHLLHSSTVQRYEKEKEDGKSDDKDRKISDGVKKTFDKATQTEDKQPTVENKGQPDGRETKPHHTKVYKADGEEVAGSGSRPRRMTRAEDGLRPQLQPLCICPYHGEDNCEVDDPEWYDGQQRRYEHDHLSMDSITSLVARPPQSYDPRSSRGARYYMSRYLRPFNVSNYRPPRELHQENRDLNASTAQQIRGLRGGALPTSVVSILDDDETVGFRERDCKCVKYMVRGHGQPIELVPNMYQVICEEHDPNLQSRQARETWAERGMKIICLRGGASQAKAAEESHKKEVSMEHDRMNFGNYAPVPTAVYEDKPEGKPKQTNAPNAPTSPAKPANNGNEQSETTGLRGGSMDSADEWSEASQDTGNKSESAPLSEIFDGAKEIKTRFENSGPKTGRPAPTEERSRLRVTSFIEALENPYGAADPSNSSGCERSVNLPHGGLERWDDDDHELKKMIRGIQGDSSSTSIRAGQVDVRKRELEDREEMLEAKEKTLNRKSRDFTDAKAEFMKNFSTVNRSSSSRGDLAAELPNSKPQPVDASIKAPSDVRGRGGSVSGPGGGASNAYKPTTSNGARGNTISPTETRDPLSVKLEQVGMNEDKFESARAYQLVFDYQQQEVQGQREVLSSDYLTPYFFDNSSKTKQELYDCQDDKRKLLERLDDLQGEIKMLRGRCYVLEQSNQPFKNCGMGMPGPANFPAPPYYGYPAYSAYPQQNLTSHQQSQRLVSAPAMTAFPMYGGSGTRFKPQPSEQLLADGGPDPEEFMTQRQQRQTGGSNEQVAAEKKDKENDQGWSQTWDAQALKDAEQEDATGQKKQEKYAEEERKDQQQAWNRVTGWYC